tara:strand:+ start:214 stop:525 length:312 start_codon:yes stop_codon:yes gene_type:complete
MNKLNKGFKPHGDKVVIELCEKKQEFDKIIYEDKKNIPWVKGRVMSIGRGVKDQNGNIHPAEFEVDDYVVFDKTKGVESYEGLAIIDIRSVVMVVEEDTEISG